MTKSIDKPLKNNGKTTANNAKTTVKSVKKTIKAVKVPDVVYLGNKYSY